VALWETLPATASHQGAFDFPDTSRPLLEAVAGISGLLPLLREVEARLEADVEAPGDLYPRDRLARAEAAARARQPF
jgi:hypothetical protein